MGTLRTLSLPALASAAVVGCTIRKDHESSVERAAAAENAGADSLVLARTGCYGVCAAYRVRLLANDSVAFDARSPSDSGHYEGRATTPFALDSLVRRARAIGFRDLPEVVRDDPALCRLWATDQWADTVRLYARDGVETVVDYAGCFFHSTEVPERLRRLRAFEAAIDSLTGSARWARRATGR